MVRRHLLTILICCAVGVGVWSGLAHVHGTYGTIGPPVPAAVAQELFKKLGVVRSAEIAESSGLASSQVDENRIWTINDSGSAPDLFALDLTGQLMATIRLPRSENTDWEAMCSFRLDGKPFLLVADVGDNGAKRGDCRVYLFPEPESLEQVTIDPVSVRGIAFEYEDGPRNCEAVAVDQETGELWLVEKVYYESRQTTLPGVYVIDLNAEPDQVQTARRIGDFAPRNVTGMAFSPNGRRLIVRTYTNAYLFERPEKKTWRDALTEVQPIPVPLPLQRQGEAICFTPDSKQLIVSSEYRRQALWQVDLEKFLELESQLGPDRIGIYPTDQSQTKIK